VHVHNTLPLASPSVHYAASAERIPVIQTLHNYRLLCPNALLLRNNQPCTSCVGAAPVRAIQHACYRGSRTATAAVAAMLTVHRAAGTWHRTIDTFIATTEFARRMFVAGGLPPDRIVVKPHSVDPDPGPGTGQGGYALYVGRLSQEKGIDTLLAAWSRLGGLVRLVIVGDGPLAPIVAAAAARIPGVTWLGRRERGEVQQLMADAATLVFPSIAFETFGQVVAEAYAAGTPVIASSGGAAAELVSPGSTGLLVRPGNADDLADAVRGLLCDPAAAAAMRHGARAAYESRFTSAANYHALMDIYRNAAGRAAARGHAAPPAIDCAVRHPEEARS
jgi:glycosyltransferase involved in cell wall biosynthesis